MLHEEGMLLIADVVTSLGGHEVQIDDWYVDAAYSATQKCLSCPPGLSPVTFSPAAVEVMERRKTRPVSWYFDVAMLKEYYEGSSQRAYHHTPPVNLIYALHEGLSIILEEGLDARDHKACLGSSTVEGGIGGNWSRVSPGALAPHAQLRPGPGGGRRCGRAGGVARQLRH